MFRNESENTRLSDNKKSFDDFLKMTDLFPSALIILQSEVVLYANDQFCNQFSNAYTEGIIGMNIANSLKFSSPSDKELFENAVRDTSVQKFENKITICLQLSNTNKCKVSVRIKNIDFIEGNNIALFFEMSSQSDIAQTYKSQHSYEHIISHAETALIELNKNGRITFLNNYAKQLLGYHENELIGRNIGTTVFADELSSFEKSNRFLDIDFFLKNPYYEIWCNAKNDKRVYIAWRSSPFKNSKGEIDGTLLSGTDFTEQQILMNTIKENEAKFRQVFNSISDSIVIFDPDTLRVVEANDVALHRRGLHKSQLFDLTLLDFVPSAFVSQVGHLRDVIKEKIFINVDFDTNDFSGRKYPLEINARIFKFGGRDMIIAVGRDISDRVQVQKKIYNAVIKAEEKERSRIAKELHDGVSPILSAIKLYTQTLLNNKNEDLSDKIGSKIEETIEEAITSISEISNNLSPHVLQNFGLQVALKSFIKKIKDTKSVNINFDTNIEERLNPEIEFTLYRVIIELMNNTIKHANAQNITVNLSLNDELHLTYCDDGVGFDVQQTLKDGKGMGLFNIDNRIKAINGFFNIASKVHKGTDIEIILPYFKQKNLEL